MDPVTGRSSAVRFYADLNCPFCYAENEMLTRLECDDVIDWRGVVHMPDLAIPWGGTSDSDRAMITKFVARLRDEVFELDIVEPTELPNSRPATLILAELKRRDRSAAARARTALFRALWRDNLDISRHDVIKTVLEGVGVALVEPSRDAKRDIMEWKTEWRTGPFDQRIPVLTTDSGDRLLGFGEQDRIAWFLATHDPGEHLPDACRMAASS